MDPMDQDKLDSKRGSEDGAWEERNQAEEDPGPARQVLSSAGLPGPSGVRQEEGRWCWKARPTFAPTFSKCWSSKEILAVPDCRTPEP